MIISVTKNGKPLSKDLYNWDEHARTFSTNEDGLVLDFTGIVNCTFKTGDNCTFKTGHNCTFKTGNYCTFKTGNSCTFNTGHNCTFNTGDNCIFKTYDNCIFKTYDNCTFKTYDYCIFNTGNNCIFNTGSNCTFNTDENCFVIRYDVKGVTEIPVNKTIKLNEYGVAGYTIIEEKKETSYNNIIEVNGKKYKLIEQ
jgi:hypothetical protein